MGEDLAATRVGVATVLLHLGLAATLGGWASERWLGAAASPWASVARRRSGATLRAATLFALGIDALLLWMQAAAMAQVPLRDALPMLPSIALQTHVGRAWLAGVVALAVVAAASAMQRGGVRQSLEAIGIGVFVWSRAGVSHAAAFGDVSAQLFVECVHLGAIGLWLGVVGVAAFVMPIGDAMPTAVERADAAGWVRRLSATATGALGVIVGTGLVNAWRGLGSVANLTGSAYGLALLVKVGLVAVAVLLGGYNRLRVMPPLLAVCQSPLGRPSRWQRRFARILRLEAVVLLAALVAAAVLSASPLPAAP